jgi:protein-disulfide isomerase
MRSTFLLLTMLACGTATTANGDENTASTAKTTKTEGEPTTVASWTGGTISSADLNKSLEIELIQIESEYVNSRFEARKNGLDAEMAEKLMDAEVAKRKLPTIEALLKVEVEDKVGEPTEAEIQQFYIMMKQRLRGASLEEVKPQLIEGIRQRGQAERFQAFIGELYVSYDVKLTLPRPDVPRIPISADDDPSIGPDDAVITIIQFAEFQCPYCGRAKAVVDELMKKYPGKIRMVLRDFPLSFHDRAIPAAVAANCAGEQDKYWPMYDILMANQRSLSDSDLTKYATGMELDLEKWNTCRKDPAQEAEVQKDFEDGSKAGVSGTPAFFVNGIFLNGAQPIEAFSEIIDQELAG